MGKVNEQGYPGGESLIGMPLEKAKDLLGLSGWMVRCVNADGEAKFVTQDVMPTRINVSTVGSLITKVHRVG